MLFQQAANKGCLETAFQDASEKHSRFLYISLSACLSTICILESVSEDSAVTTVITPMQCRVRGWLKA